MTTRPLNPELYNQLYRRFNGNIKIANQGYKAQYKIQSRRKLGRDGKYRFTKSIEMVQGCTGEHYVVCCPYCGDQRYRLWVNYRWGSYEVTSTGEKIPFGRYLACCYNEGCDLRGLQEELKPYVARAKHIVVADRHAKVEDPFAPKELPDGCVSVDTLPDWHHAYMYLNWDRKFDPYELCKEWEVFYTAHAENPFAQDRIIVPIRMNGLLLGYQTRFIGKKVPTGVPKYWISPGTKKAHILYNWDRAKHLSAVILVEGVTDAWRFGPMAVAMFGKKLSQPQCDLIVNEFKDKPVFMCLDSDAKEDEDVLRNKNMLYAGGYKGVVIGSKLAKGDPADYTREALFEYVRSTTSQRG